MYTVELLRPKEVPERARVQGKASSWEEQQLGEKKALSGKASWRRPLNVAFRRYQERVKSEGNTVRRVLEGHAQQEYTSCPKPHG